MSEIETLRPEEFEEVLPPPPKVPQDMGYILYGSAAANDNGHPQDYQVEAALVKMFEDHRRYLFWSRVTLWVAFAVATAALVTILVAIAQKWGML